MSNDAEVEAVALMALLRHGVPNDVLAMLTTGDERGTVPPGGLRAAIAALDGVRATPVISAEMVERGARALIERRIRIVRKWDTPADRLEKHMPAMVDMHWMEQQENAETCLRAALGLDERAAADAVHEPEEQT